MFYLKLVTVNDWMGVVCLQIHPHASDTVNEKFVESSKSQEGRRMTAEILNLNFNIRKWNGFSFSLLLYNCMPEYYI